MWSLHFTIILINFSHLFPIEIFQALIQTWPVDEFESPSKEIGLQFKFEFHRYFIRIHWIQALKFHLPLTCASNRKYWCTCTADFTFATWFLWQTVEENLCSTSDSIKSLNKRFLLPVFYSLSPCTDLHSTSTATGALQHHFPLTHSTSHHTSYSTAACVF